MEGERERKNPKGRRTIKTSERKKRQTKREKAQYMSRHIQKKAALLSFSPFLTSFVLIDFRLMYVPLDAG